MSDPKPLASLSSSLLARKGQAAPAMRRQSMMLSAMNAGQPEGEHAPLDDLGWNDMGDTHEEPVRQATGLSPMPQLAPVVTEPQPIMPSISIEQVETPAVVRQQVELERELAKPVVEALPVAIQSAPAVAAPVVPPPTFVETVKAERAPKVPVQRAAPGSRGKAAFTLRLDADRHLKLRLVCAVNHRSAQQIVTQALDEFLANQPSVNDLVAGRGAN